MDQGAAGRIAALEAWRRGGAVAAVASGALLASGWPEPVGPLPALTIAAAVVAVTHVALRHVVRGCALDPDLAGIPAVARCRRALCSRRRRRALASALRQTVRRSGRERENDLVLWSRVRLVASELVSLADELDAAHSVEPRTMFDIDQLLCDGHLSPMLNDQLPTGELASAVRSIRFRLETAAAGRDPPPPKIGTSTDGGADGIRVSWRRLAGHGPTKRRGVG